MFIFLSYNLSCKNIKFVSEDKNFIYIFILIKVIYLIFDELFDILNKF